MCKCMLQIEVITVRNGVAKVMFLQACFCKRGGVPDQVHPLGPGTPPRPGKPQDQVHPPGPGTLVRYTPQDQVHPPDQVHPSGPGTPPWDQVHPPRPGTPSWTRYTPSLRPGTPPPSDQVHPLPQTR